MKTVNKNKINQVEQNNVISFLTNKLEQTKYLYKTNTISNIHLKRKGYFISDILNDCINDIFDKLENGIFTFKYQIYERPSCQPHFLFSLKEDLKKNMFFKEIDDYKYKVFGIRLEFIDPDSNRYIYIITID